VQILAGRSRRVYCIDSVIVPKLTEARNRTEGWEPPVLVGSDVGPAVGSVGVLPHAMTEARARAMAPARTPSHLHTDNVDELFHRAG